MLKVLFTLIACASLFADPLLEDCDTCLIDLVLQGQEIEDSLARELIAAPVMQRLKRIDQSGIVRYTIPLPEFTRFSHCIGVYALLLRYKAPREEQIAGLLHDASHTVFSHVGDLLFDHEDGPHSYQDIIHAWSLEQQNVQPLLEREGMTIEGIIPENPAFTRLEQPLPDLCADRIEYNLHTALLLHMLTTEDVKQILSDLHFENGSWFFTKMESAKRFAAVSLNLTQNFFGVPWNGASYLWAVQMLKRAFELKILSEEMIHFSDDDTVLSHLKESDDPIIQSLWEKMRAPEEFYTLSPPAKADFTWRTKFRGVDPLVHVDGELRRLTEINPLYRQMYLHAKKGTAYGWPLKWTPHVREATSLAEIEPFLEKADENTLVIFDVDHVLIVPNNPALHKSSMKAHPNLLKRYYLDLPQDTRHAINLSVAEMDNQRVVESATIPVIESLKARGIPTVALTAAGRHNLLPEWRVDQLAELGISFDPLIPNQIFEELPANPGHAEGILATNGRACSKGDLLSTFLSKLDWTPEHIIFIDDSKRHLESVQKMLETLGMNGTLFLYTHVADSQHEIVDREAFETTWKQVVMNVEIPPRALLHFHEK